MGAHTSFDPDGVDVVGRLPRPISLVAGVDRVCGLRCYAQMAESASGIHGMEEDGDSGKGMDPFLPGEAAQIGAEGWVIQGLQRSQDPELGGPAQSGDPAGT